MIGKNNAKELLKVKKSKEKVFSTPPDKYDWQVRFASDPSLRRFMGDMEKIEAPVRLHVQLFSEDGGVIVEEVFKTIPFKKMRRITV